MYKNDFILQSVALNYQESLRARLTAAQYSNRLNAEGAALEIAQAASKAAADTVKAIPAIVEMADDETLAKLYDTKTESE
ncbi:MAG: hypothetical protein LIO91_10030 [Bacteroidales bacterium]|nr:hypothetical protein [Bacteroidales bacterium]